MKTITYNPETHVLVPRAPTRFMVALGWDSAVEHGADNIDSNDTAAIYRAMIAAAPQPEPVESEPAMWVMKHIRSGDLAQAKPNQKALHPYMWSDAFPRYTTPQPDRTAELREICAAIDDPASDLTLTTVECIKKLKAENASLKLDAERYQWLRDVMSKSIGGGVEVNDAALVYETSEPGEEVRVYWYPDTPIGFYDSKGSTLDEAIDIAMAQGDK